MTIMFDLDGTLTRSERGIILSARLAAEQVGYGGLPDEAWMAFIGPPMIDDSFMMITGMSREEADRAVVLYRERYSRVGWSENEVYTGIPRMLRTLRRAGHRLAIVTSKPEVNAKKIADRFGLTPFMDALVAPTPQERHSTKDNLIRRAQSMLPGPYVMVGDRRFDVEGARKTGIASVGVTYGYGSREELEGSGADMIADTPMDVCRLLAPDAPGAPGWLITMEGVDGCGKTTQRRALEECLLERGYDLVHTREPGGDDIAERIRDLILDPANTGMCDLAEAYLYAASRAQHVRSRLQPAIREGKMVLCDRFVDSSIAYQGGGRGLGAELVQSINAPAVDTCRPDLVIYLQMDPKEALSRRLGASAPDRLEQEDVAFFERTAAAYEQAFSGRQEVLRVNAGQEIGAVTAEMLSGVCRRLDEINGKDAAWQK